MQLTMCGYRCDLCKAYAPNVNKSDQREKQVQVWNKYYGGFDESAFEGAYCDGCRCEKSNAKRIDMGCPVRKCVIEKELSHCGNCGDYPCDTFNLRAGLTFEEAENKLGDRYDADEYEEYLRAFDNKTRLNEYIEAKRT